jgi:hypothetical protein
MNKKMLEEEENKGFESKNGEFGKNGHFVRKISGELKEKNDSINSDKEIFLFDFAVFSF